jgi:hypothetical protein
MQEQGISWLRTPGGEPFFSLGVNVLDSGYPERLFKGRRSYHWGAFYTDQAAWARAAEERLAHWGFNTAGAWSLPPDRLRLRPSRIWNWAGPPSSTGSTPSLRQPPGGSGARPQTSWPPTRGIPCGSAISWTMKWAGGTEPSSSGTSSSPRQPHQAAARGPAAGPLPK